MAHKWVGVTFRNLEKVKPYERALRMTGIEPVRIHPEGLQGMEGLDGLLLTGGTDVNPKLYHQEPHAANDEPDDARDAMEQRMLHSALEKDLPVLAICRGMQLLNVTLGGTLQQHVDGHRHPGVAEAHRIEVDPGTALAQAIGAGAHLVNSRHHQIVGRIGAGLKVTARSEDEYPEALEREDRKFVLAVQWHPEDLVESHAEARQLFEAFARSL
jgi:putative glutamine amidotransferase